MTDPQGRKHGEQTGLDTLVVHALNVNSRQREEPYLDLTYTGPV